MELADIQNDSELNGMVGPIVEFNVPLDTVLGHFGDDSDLKRDFSEQDLMSFDSGHVSSDSYPNLSQDARNFTVLFGSTYCCEQLFSRIKNTK